MSLVNPKNYTAPIIKSNQQYSEKPLIAKNYDKNAYEYKVKTQTMETITQSFSYDLRNIAKHFDRKIGNSAHVVFRIDFISMLDKLNKKQEQLASLYDVLSKNRKNMNDEHWKLLVETYYAHTLEYKNQVNRIEWATTIYNELAFQMKLFSENWAAFDNSTTKLVEQVLAGIDGLARSDLDEYKEDLDDIAAKPAHSKNLAVDQKSTQPPVDSHKVDWPREINGNWIQQQLADKLTQKNIEQILNVEEFSIDDWIEDFVDEVFGQLQNLQQELLKKPKLTDADNRQIDIISRFAHAIFDELAALPDRIKNEDINLDINSYTVPWKYFEKNDSRGLQWEAIMRGDTIQSSHDYPLQAFDHVDALHSAFSDSTGQQDKLATFMIDTDAMVNELSKELKKAWDANSGLTKELFPDYNNNTATAWAREFTDFFKNIENRQKKLKMKVEKLAIGSEEREEEEETIRELRAIAESEKAFVMSLAFYATKEDAEFRVVGRFGVDVELEASSLCRALMRHDRAGKGKFFYEV